MAQQDRPEPDVLATGHSKPGLWGPGVPRRWWTVPTPSRTLSGFAFIVLVCTLALITAASLRPSLGGPDLPQIDKVFHFAAYLVVSALAGIALRGRLRAGVALAVAWGIGIEIAQGTMALGRHLSVADIAANTFGAVAGAWLVGKVLQHGSRRRA